MTGALPTNGGYVAAAYLVFLALLLVYFAIMATRTSRLERELQELNTAVEDAAAAQQAPAVAPQPEPVGGAQQ